MKKCIAQIGSFDVENFGDLLFPDVMRAEFNEELDIDLFSPRGGNKCFDILKVYPINQFEKKCKEKNYSAVVIGGGDLIRTDGPIFIRNNTYSTDSYSSLELWAYPILIAKKYGIPVLFNSPGVTNDFDESEKNLVKIILELVDDLNVRDTESQKALNSIGIFDVKVIPDSVNVINKIYSTNYLEKVYFKLTEEGILDKDIGEYIVFQHNSTNIDDAFYYRELLKGIKHISKGKNILFMPIGYVHDDMKVLEKIFSERIENTYIVNSKRKLTPVEMIAILEHSKGYMGTSMHGAVVSYSYGNPILLLNSMNSKKIHGFANVTGNQSVDISCITDLIYIYDHFFGVYDKKLKSKIDGRIESHFIEMRKFIDNHEQKKVDTTQLLEFLAKSYEDKNELYYMVVQQEDYLNRKIKKYIKLNDSEFYIKFDELIENTFFFPTINKKFYATEIVVDGRKILSESYLFEKTKIYIKQASEIRVKGHFCSDYEWYYYIGNIIDSFEEMREKLINTEVALKQAEMYYDAYKQNIEKYIENE